MQSSGVPKSLNPSAVSLALRNCPGTISANTPTYINTYTCSVSAGLRNAGRLWAFAQPVLICDRMAGAESSL